MSAKPKAVTATKTANCLCNSVQISVTGTDKGAITCHCSNCQHATGSAYAWNHRLLKAKLTFIKGEDLVKQYADTNTKSGNTLYRHFCSNCGSPLYLTNSAFQGLVVLHAGSIDGDRDQPLMELFPEDKHSWTGNYILKAKV